MAYASTTSLNPLGCIVYEEKATVAISQSVSQQADRAKVPDEHPSFCTEAVQTGFDITELIILSPGVMEEGGGWDGFATGTGVSPGTGVAAGVNCGVGDACEPVYVQEIRRLSPIFSAC